MPLIHNTPISITALNHNIDGDLIFNDTYAAIKKTTDLSELALMGGVDPDTDASIIRLIGLNGGYSTYFSASVNISIPYLGSETQVLSAAISAAFVEPCVYMYGWRIEGLKDPLNSDNAATKNYVDTTLGLGTQGDLTVSAPIAISNATRHLIGGAAALSLVNDAAATITEIDTSALASSDTKIPTSKATKDYADGLITGLGMSNYLKKDGSVAMTGILDHAQQAITGAAQMRNGGNSALISLDGGDGVGSGAGAINLYGKTQATKPGGIMFYCADNAGSYFVLMEGVGNVAAPHLNMHSNRIAALAAPTTAGDALPYQAWASWAATLTWGTATPTGQTVYSRWTQIGKTVFWTVAISATDGKGATSLTISLPVTASANNFVTTSTGRQKIATVHTPIYPYVTTSATIISFIGFSTWTNGQACALQISGFYEVD